MRHTELSPSGQPEEQPDEDDPGAGGDIRGAVQVGESSVRHWAAVVATAAEPCVVLDSDGMIVASSPACRALLTTAGPVVTDQPPDGFGDGSGQEAGADVASPDAWTGRGLLEVVHLVDLTATRTPLPRWETERIPPLLALASANLARGLIRIRIGELTRTVDTVSTPLCDGNDVVGSLSFLRPI